MRAFDMTIGVLGAALTVTLLITAQKLFGQKVLDADYLGALALLASAAQAFPLLGFGMFARDQLLARSDTGRTRGTDNIALVALVAFSLAFLGVFALLYSIVFIPLVLLGVVAKLFYRPLSRNTPRARATWRVIALSALAAGGICVAFTASFV